MMWQVQVFADLMTAWLQSDQTINLIFAALCLWAAHSKEPKVCAWITALVHVILALL